MRERKLIVHPKTKIKKTCYGWAKEYGVHQSTINGWFQASSYSQVFDALDAGVRSSPKGAPPKMYQNPFTEEVRTIKEWAIKLDYHPNYLRVKIRAGEVCLIALNKDDTVFSPEPIEHITRSNVLLCTNPLTGESLPAFEWAKRYGVPLSEFYQAMKKYGKDNISLFNHFKKVLE